MAATRAARGNSKLLVRMSAGRVYIISEFWSLIKAVISHENFLDGVDILKQFFVRDIIIKSLLSKLQVQTVKKEINLDICSSSVYIKKN